MQQRFLIELTERASYRSSSSHALRSSLVLSFFLIAIHRVKLCLGVNIGKQKLICKSGMPSNCKLCLGVNLRKQINFKERNAF